MANEFTYFTQLLMYTTAIYAIILGIFLCIRRTEIKQRADDEPIEHQIMHRDERWTFTYTTPMRVMYDSTWGKKARPFLLVTRIVSVAFIFLSGIIVPATQDQSAFYYFDGWSIVLTFLYFCAVLTLTIITIYSYRTRSELDRQISEDIHWSYKIRTLAVWTHLLFEVCGASTIASIFINMQSFQSKSTVLELQTLVIFALLVLEMMLNNIRVRFDQLPASIAWMMFYFIVIWPAVMTVSDTSHTSHPQCRSNLQCLLV